MEALARGAALALCLAAIVGSAGCRYSHPHALHVDGNQLADARGEPLRLLGVNRSGTEYACVQGWGVFDGPTHGSAIEVMKSWRINAVRIPLNEHCWLGTDGTPARYGGRRYRAKIRAFVRRLHRAGMYVVLDLHWSAPGTEKAGKQQPMADLDHAPDFWRSVARTFKHDPSVAFDLYNEPHGVSWTCWRDGCLLPEGWRTAGMQTLVDAVRSTGARQPVIATGIDFGTNLSSWLEYRPHDPADQLVAGFHVYDFTHCNSPDCWTSTIEPVARQVPVVASEVGQKDCLDRFLDRFTGWADSAGLSYLGWNWSPHGCDAPSLIKSWDGQPTASGRLLRTRLRMAAAPRLP